MRHKCVSKKLGQLIDTGKKKKEVRNKKQKQMLKKGLKNCMPN